MRSAFVLPLPGFVLNPFTAAVIAGVHLYLAFGHLSQLFGGDIQWTHIWKGLGALLGAYVFAALASRGMRRSPSSRYSNPENPVPALNPNKPPNVKVSGG